MKTVVLAMLFCLTSISTTFGQTGNLKIALLKYRGGGDWYGVVDALENVAQYYNSTLNANLNPNYATVEVSSPEIFNYPFLFITGHGNIIFSEQEAENLRTYLEAGGFLYIDDDYGMEPFVRKALQKVFPQKKMVEIPFDHPIYHQTFDFDNGVPKIHEHDGKAPQAFGIFLEDRLAVLFTYESNVSDGWDSPEVHNDPPSVREKALKMGVNILQYAFTQ